jgi:hypothetical protein
VFQSLISFCKRELNRRREGRHCLEQIVNREGEKRERERERMRTRREKDREREKMRTRER